MRFMLDGEVAAQGAGKVRMATLLSINNYYYHRGGAEAIFFAHNKMFEALGWQGCFIRNEAPDESRYSVVGILRRTNRIWRAILAGPKAGANSQGHLLIRSQTQTRSAAG